VDVPETRYARAEDGAYLAYQVVGDGPVDIAWLDDAYTNLSWQAPWESAWYRGLASFARVIVHDRRAIGLSSRNVPVPNLETRAADLLTVLDAAGSMRTVIGGWLESLAPGILLAATEPERVRALVWWSPTPRTTWAPDYPWGSGQEEVDQERRSLEHWGTMEYARMWAEAFASNHSGAAPAEEDVRAMAMISASTCTPDVAIELTEVWWQSDVRGVLPSVHVPTLLIAQDEDGSHVEVTHHVASLMPNAKTQIFGADDSEAWSKGDFDWYSKPRLEAIQRFVGIEPARSEMDSILSTVLFTDIVDSTETQAAIGDQQWKELIQRHHEVVRNALDRWNGVENDTAGDGFYATFDGPARAIRCAEEVIGKVRPLGLQIRAGVHTGECRVIDGKIGGLAVSIGARVAANAGPSEVLISQTVKDLVAGSGLVFEDAGEHELKGVPDRWHLYRVVG
jgi:class 3 adenylate cyclase/pimeloyl-ACP methyl ester carboxylesterase